MWQWCNDKTENSCPCRVFIQNVFQFYQNHFENKSLNSQKINQINNSAVLFWNQTKFTLVEVELHRSCLQLSKQCLVVPNETLSSSVNKIIFLREKSRANKFLHVLFFFHHVDGLTRTQLQLVYNSGNISLEEALVCSADWRLFPRRHLF